MLERLPVMVARIRSGRIFNYVRSKKLRLQTFSSPKKEIASVQVVLNDAVSFAIERTYSTKIGFPSL